MIKRFDTFNEAKLVQGDLLEDVKNAFAFLVDDNPNISISDQRTSKSEQVSVLIPNIISPSRKYTIEEYADVQNRWNEIVQDAWVAAQQLTDKGTISVDATIEGYIRLKFYTTTNSDVFKINSKTVYFSKVNLLKSCKIPSCGIKVKNHVSNWGSTLSFEFDEQQSVDELNEIISNLRYITSKYGLTFIVMNTTIQPTFYLSIRFKVPIPDSVRTGALKKFILKDII